VAAGTQGVSLPPIKHIKAGFSRMRVFCGDAEVTPIHPFKIEQRLGQEDAVYEGLYVFDPGAIGPHCGTAKVTLFSDKDPEKGDTRVIDPKILQQIWQDFAPYRAGRGNLQGRLVERAPSNQRRLQARGRGHTPRDPAALTRQRQVL